MREGSDNNAAGAVVKMKSTSTSAFKREVNESSVSSNSCTQPEKANEQTSQKDMKKLSPRKEEISSTASAKKMKKGNVKWDQRLNKVLQIRQ